MLVNLEFLLVNDSAPSMVALEGVMICPRLLLLRRFAVDYLCGGVMRSRFPNHQCMPVSLYVSSFVLSLFVSLYVSDVPLSGGVVCFVVLGPEHV